MLGQGSLAAERAAVAQAASLGFLLVQGIWPPLPTDKESVDANFSTFLDSEIRLAAGGVARVAARHSVVAVKKAVVLGWRCRGLIGLHPR